MRLSYDKLWNMLFKLNVNKMKFAKTVGISNATLAKLGKNEPVALTVLIKICEEYNCKIENIMEFIPDTPQNFPDISAMDVGTITICSPFPLHMHPKYKLSKFQNNTLRKCPCVILEKIYKNDSVMQILVAPLLYQHIPETIFDISFLNLELNDERIEHGYIQLGKMGYTSPRTCEKILGKMPDKYMHEAFTCLEKIRPFIKLIKPSN